MLKLGRAQGVAMAAAMMNDISVVEYSPKRIKQSVTGNGNASKEQVAAMVERLVNVSLDDYSLDATDALATAICHHLQGSSKVQKSGGRKSWSSFISENPDRLGGPK
jgi:crossover junction endodeoxyribonuclease RuvC